MTPSNSSNDSPLSIFWFRRDLRLEDNKGLYHALKDGQVVGLFIFDSDILDDLVDRDDARVTFIHDRIGALREQVPSLWVRYGKPLEVFREIVAAFPVKTVYANMDFEPYGLLRDGQIADYLKTQGIPFHSFLDHLVHHPREVLKADGTPYTVFTPSRSSGS